METLYFHEHEELAGEMQYRITVMMSKTSLGESYCEILVAVRDTLKVPSIYETKLIAGSRSSTPKKAYHKAYHILRNRNNILKHLSGHTYL